jgi:APA family basic amino acid/polyamine antiporter
MGGVARRWAAARRRAGCVSTVADLAARGGAAAAASAAAGGAGTLPKLLGAWDLTFLGVGSIVGAGVFVLSGVVARDVAGPAVVVSYALAAAAALLSALCYCEYAVELPLAGGAYNYIAVTFGELMAWSVAWNMVLEIVLSAAAVARGFSGYAAALFGAPPGALLVRAGPLLLDPAAAALVATLTLLLCLGTRGSSRVNIAVSCVNLAAVGIVLCAGFPLADTANIEPFAPHGARGTVAGASIVFFAYVGFDYIANTAEEAKQPGRDVPLAIGASLGVATLLYLAMAACLALAAPAATIDVAAPFAALFVAHGKPLVARVVALGAATGIVTSTLTGILSAARLFVVLGREALLPRSLARVHARTQTPLTATLLTGALTGAVALLVDIGTLAELVSVGTLYVFWAVCCGVAFRRLHQPGRGPGARPPLAALAALSAAALAAGLAFAHGAPWPVLAALLVVWAAAAAALALMPVLRAPAGFATPLFPAAPAAGALCTLFLVGSLRWLAFARFALWLLTGAAVYALYGAAGAEALEAEAWRRARAAGEAEGAAEEAGGGGALELAALAPERPAGEGDAAPLLLAGHEGSSA